MWAGMAGFGGPPALTGDLLWWFLAGALAVPFLVYAGSMAVDEQRS